MNTKHCRRWQQSGWLFAALSVGALVCGGCSGETKKPAPTPAPTSSATSASGPLITATPNPVPAGSEKFGTTTIAWDTGSKEICEVYVSTNGEAEKLFASGQPRGSLEANWIGNKGTYEFRLYAGKEHKTVLASVNVNREGN